MSGESSGRGSSTGRRPQTASVSYERSAEVLRIVEASRVTRFGFVGNEKYRVFDRSR